MYYISHSDIFMKLQIEINRKSNVGRMNEWMFNDTPAQYINQLLGVRQMVTKK